MCNRILEFRPMSARFKVLVDEQTVARNVFVMYKIDPIFAPLPKSAVQAPTLNKSIQITSNCYTASTKCLSFSACM